MWAKLCKMTHFYYSTVEKQTRAPVLNWFIKEYLKIFLNIQMIPEVRDTTNSKQRDINMYF